MTSDPPILDDAKAFVSGLLAGKLASWVTYHDLRHTEETVEACREIAAASGLSSPDTEIALLAAWFHDTGYTETAKGHEEVSAAIGGEWLRARKVPEERIAAVQACIRATELPQRPTTPAAKAVCDADIFFLGRGEFFTKNELLRREIERREGIVFEDREWLERSLRFLEGQSYHTEYCRTSLTAGLRSNIERLREQIAALP